jgi:hypothetical protein
MQTWRQLPFPGFSNSFRYGPTSCSAGMVSNIRSSDLGVWRWGGRGGARWLVLYIKPGV